MPSRVLAAFGAASAIFCLFSAIGCGANAGDASRGGEANETSARMISVGDAEVCAVANGAVQCFVPGSAARTIEGLADAVEVASGHDHACARTTDGSVFCWGNNAWGQLGNGSLQPSATPVRVAVQGATSIAAGFGKSCATTIDGRLQCWGARETDPHLITVDAKPATAPYDVEGVRDAVAVTLGAFHGCALEKSGDVACFGANYFGQLGDGTNTARDIAAPVSELHGASAIAAGTHHTCALVKGHVSCWGADIAGQQGAPAVPGGVRLVPAEIDGVTHASSIAAGGDHTCAIVANEKARCWGWNDRGQVARGAAMLVRAPVVARSSVLAIAASDTHTCAIDAAGAIDCWGAFR